MSLIARVYACNAPLWKMLLLYSRGFFGWHFKITKTSEWKRDTAATIYSLRASNEMEVFTTPRT